MAELDTRVQFNWNRGAVSHLTGISRSVGRSRWWVGLLMPAIPVKRACDEGALALGKCGCTPDPAGCDSI